KALGRTIRYVDVPPEEFKKSLLSAGLPEWSADALLDLQRYYREGGASLVDPAVERLTGRKPRSFDDFARDYSSAFQQEARAAG
ncbi:MAG: SDR family NAD(P)-dependent oxidoreductase, partial [Acidobacteria bacterium]|nr:SDR family NAD(P)-dependent oxidoreductase [Acidobacteriota bacterium]